MYTESVSLEEIAEEEFFYRHKNWGTTKKPKQGERYYLVTSPIVKKVSTTDDSERVDDYAKLINCLLDHPHFFELSVRNGRVWARVYWNSKPSADEIRELAYAASNDTFKKNYLEIKFKPREDLKAAAEIEFIEHEDLAIGYQVSVPKTSIGMFNFETRANMSFFYHQGISIPPGQINLQYDRMTRL